MPSALAKIRHRAKQIRKGHASMAWKTAIKKASAEYRAAKKTPARKRSVRRPAHKRKVSAVITRPAIHSVVTGTSDGMSIGSLKSRLKNKMKEGLGKLLLRKEMATTKRVKRQLSKSITHVKGQLRKLD